MGLTIDTYCCPYVECKVQKTKGIRQERRCPHTSCKMHMAISWSEMDKFCNHCGSAIVTVNVECEKDVVDTWELEEDLCGALWQPFGDYTTKLSDQGIHIWVGGKDEICIE